MKNKPILGIIAVVIVLLVFTLVKANSIYMDYSYSSLVHSPLLRISLPSEMPPPPVTGEEPVRIVADSVGIDISILNPTSTDKNVLEKAMLTSAVRYPTSALLGQEGTVMLMGHSSNVLFVRNKGYKAFNGLQNLKKGEVVKVYSDRSEYRFAVTSIRLVKNERDIVELRSNGKDLKLITTDLRDKSFNTRWLIEADFMGSN